MIIELAMNAENSNLKREAKAIFKGAVDMNAVLFDPNIRRQVLESLERKGELVYLSWKIGSRGATVGMQGRLQITLYNKESEYQTVKETFEDRKSADLRKKSLQDFYKQLPEGEANTGRPLLPLLPLRGLREGQRQVRVPRQSDPRFRSHRDYPSLEPLAGAWAFGRLASGCAPAGPRPSVKLI